MKLKHRLIVTALTLLTCYAVVASYGLAPVPITEVIGGEEVQGLIVIHEDSPDLLTCMDAEGNEWIAVRTEEIIAFEEYGIVITFRLFPSWGWRPRARGRRFAPVQPG